MQKQTQQSLIDFYMGVNAIQWGENSILANERISTCAGMNLSYYFTLYAKKKKNPKWTKSLTIKSIILNLNLLKG